MDSALTLSPSTVLFDQDQKMTANTPLEEHVHGTVVWLSRTARAMVDKPQHVYVEGYLFDDHVRLDLRVHDEDIGQIVGRMGRSAQALRTLLMAIGRNRGIRYRLNILE